MTIVKVVAGFVAAAIGFWLTEWFMRIIRGDD